MRTGNFSAQIGAFLRQFRIVYPDAVSFIFSPQHMTITATDSTSYAYGMAISVKCGTRTVAEVRDAYKGIVRVDLSRMMQLATDADPEELRANYDSPVGSSGLARDFEISVAPVSTTVSPAAFTFQTAGMYGAVNLGESYGPKVDTLRLWINYPQTISIWGAVRDISLYFKSTEQDRIPLTQPGTPGSSLFGVQALLDEMTPQSDLVYDGVPGTSFRLAGAVTVSNGELITGVTRDIRLITDLAPMGQGAYLRWMDNFGEWRYWLFKPISKAAQTATAGFTRYPLNDPGIYRPSDGLALNPQRAFYDIEDTMEVAAPKVSASEYDYLISLATSPVVDLLANGSATSPQWMRVNVAAGSYTRSLKCGAARQDFPVKIILPKKNTIQL